PSRRTGQIRDHRRHRRSKSASGLAVTPPGGISTLGLLRDPDPSILRGRQERLHLLPRRRAGLDLGRDLRDELTEPGVDVLEAPNRLRVQLTENRYGVEQPLHGRVASPLALRQAVVPRRVAIVATPLTVERGETPMERREVSRRRAREREEVIDRHPDA